MFEWVVLGFLLAVYVVAWIEFLPKRLDVIPLTLIGLCIIGFGIGLLPHWLGFVAIMLGVAKVNWVLRRFGIDVDWRGVRSVFGGMLRAVWTGIQAALAFLFGLLARATRSAAGKVKTRRERMDTAGQPRRWPSALGLIALSPIAAIPAALIISLALVVGSVVFDIVSGELIDFGVLFPGWLAGGFLMIAHGLDLSLRGFLIVIPVLGVAGYAGAKFALSSESYWRGFRRSALALGSIYPALFLVGYVAGWLAPMTN